MRPWGVTEGAGRLHTSQSICRECGLVFSNPACDWSDLESFYRDDFWDTHWPDALKRDALSVERSIARQRDEAAMILKYASVGRLLEVGSGTGGFLAAAKEKGFDAWGIETSESAVKHSREVFGLQNVLHGSVPDARLPEGTFDVIHCWHVIEHVTDLDAFIASLRALLKPAGLLYLGTENYKNASHYLERAKFRLRGLPPPFATASEHTMLFTVATLGDAVERRGFEVVMAEAYQPSWAEKRSWMKFRSPLSELYYFMQHAANSAANTGPLLRMAARKR